MRTQRRRLLALTAALLLVGYATFVNAWCGDDPYITFRTVDNAVHGYGLTWNPFERVQVFTHPLWALLMTGAYALTHEAYYTVMVASLAASLGVVLVLHAASRRAAWWTTPLAAMLLVGSKPYVDYSTSGLENPLTHLLVCALFAIVVFGRSAVMTERRLAAVVLLASLVYLNRADAVLVVVPALGWALWNARRLRWRAVRAVAVGTLPAWAWTAFSVVYYGFPFPNTAYAKLNGGHMEPMFHPNAIAYFANSLAMDRLTLPLVGATVVVGGVVASLSRRSRLALLPLAGAAAYLAYAMRIGGDYMSGRLFALPMLCAVIAIVRLVGNVKVAGGIAVAALAVSLLGPRPPITSAGTYPSISRDPTGTRDERGDYYPASGLMLVLREHREDPGRADGAIGLRMRIGPPQAIVWGAIGYHGFVYGPDVYTIDNLGLSDALVSRLPARAIESAWGRGHLFRDVPAGYIESVEMGENRVVDPALHAYYDRLLVVTTGPIWRWERFRAIWELNTGKLTPLLAEYAAHAAGRR